MTTSPRWAVFRASLRRSAALRALPVLVAVSIGHVLARNQTWAHEWMWACYQYQFVTVLLGPLLKPRPKAC